jgi:hypothetical protein
MNKEIKDVKRELSKLSGKKIDYEKPNSEKVNNTKNKNKIDEVISKNVKVVNDGQVIVKSDTETIATLLRCNNREAVGFLIDVPDEEKRNVINENNEEENTIRLPYVKKAVDTRQDANTTAEQKAELRYISDSLQAINSSDEVMTLKMLSHATYDKIDKSQKRIKRKESDIDEISGEKIEGEKNIHHKNEKWNTPMDRVVDKDNYQLLSVESHKKKHRKKSK